MEHETSNVEQQPIRRSSGRRKAKGGGDEKKNKQPRRGMGVAKLERLREQGEIDPPFLEMNASSAWSPLAFYGLSPQDSPFLLKNPDGNVLKCYSLNCNACHKKKKINGGARPPMYRRFLGLDFGDTQNVLNQDHRGAKPPQPLGNYGHKVEVVAVHRKIGSSSNWDGGNNGVVMEYEFFPPSVKSNEEGELVGVLGNSSMPGFDASSCVDLSLKLSY
ncbi:uncharacterized protein LOC130987037 [Salvia miltiorrhiza]|uniref:uncharacterized protein LOC130987037 n=1 Tax=Salvia miltiorrhiza TaxID=226208 RepID=UPI0025ABF816|nr:uncharacterized protein LOC130987037 [Salvia miltiorrhiza]